MPAATIHAGEFVTVAGIPGRHAVVEAGVTLAILPGHTYARIRLSHGTMYGQHLPGEILTVEAYRCMTAPKGHRDAATA